MLYRVRLSDIQLPTPPASQSVYLFNDLYTDLYTNFAKHRLHHPFPEKQEHTYATTLTLWTPEDGIPTSLKLPYAAGLRYTVQTARYHMRRKTVYLRYGV